MNTQKIVPIRSMVPAKFVMVFNTLITIVALAWFTPAAFAQKDMGVSPCWICGQNQNNSPGNSDNYQPQPSPADIEAERADQARQQRLNEAHAANNQGLEFYNKGDWAKAVAFFQEAANKNPDNKTIRDNLATAQAQLATAQAQLRIQQQDRAAANNMQQAIQNFAQTLNAVPSSGGLDFDGRNSGNSPSGGNSGGLDFTSAIATPNQKTLAPALQFGDPMVVDARNVPSGLPPAVDTAIAGAFASAPPGVSDRVRKGFQAATAGDWNVAQAWFADALNRDPGNGALKNLVTAARSSAAPARQDEVVILYQKGYDAVAAGDRPGAIAAFEAAMRRDPGHGGSIGAYVAYLRATPDSTAAAVLQLPKDSDLQYLFDDQRSPAPAPVSTNRAGARPAPAPAAADPARSETPFLQLLLDALTKNPPKSKYPQVSAPRG